MGFYDISYEALEQERVRLNNKLNQIYEGAHQMEGKWHDAVRERDQYKAERDTLIRDIEALRRKNKDLAHANKALCLQVDTYFDEWQTVKNLYTTLTNHIRLKAENNPGVSRYIDLVNYIDRLEDE